MLDELVWVRIAQDDLSLLWWLVLFIEALVLFPNIEREGSQQRPIWKGTASTTYPDKSVLPLQKALVVTPPWAPW